MSEKVFLNGQILDIDNASVSISDSGFLYGAGLFETMRSCNGVVFSLDDHLDRLFSSAESLSINNTYDKKTITDAICEVLKANELTDARLRLTLTSGKMTAPQEKSESTLLITAAKLQPYPDEYYQKGVLAVLCLFKQEPSNPACGHKTLNYYHRMIALRQAHEKRAAEALWFTPDNRLAEGCVSNVFLVKDNVLYTPPLSTPVLAGIARKAVCKIALDNNMELVEKDLYIDDVLGADEIFMTNVIMQIMPVTSVEKHTVKDAKVGQVTQKMIKLFEQFVKDCCE